MSRTWKAAAAAVLLMGSALGMAADKIPDAAMDFSGHLVAVGVGVSWGHGVLHYQGKDYPYTLKGFSVPNVGVTDVKGIGEVYNLTNLQSFSGNYNAVSAGVAVAGGGSVAAMENQNGVVIHLHSNAKGLQINASVEGVSIKLDNPQTAALR